MITLLLLTFFNSLIPFFNFFIPNGDNEPIIPLETTDITDNYISIDTPGYHTLSSDIYNCSNDVGILINSDNVTLNGMGHILDGEDQRVDTFSIYMAGKTNITIYNITISDWDVGVQILNSQSNITILDSSFNGSNIGIVINNTGSVEINNCSFNEHEEWSIYILDDGADSCNIHNNTIINGTGGIRLYNRADWNNIFNNSLFGCTEYGIEVTSECYYNLIENNSLNNCGRAGISIDEYSYYCDIFDNTLINNGFSFSEPNILIYHSRYVDIFHNRIRGGNYGIKLDSTARYAKLFNNSIENQIYDGIYTDMWNYGDAEIWSNNINNCTDSGIDIRDSDDCFIFENNITNCEDGIYINNVCDGGSIFKNNISNCVFGIKAFNYVEDLLIANNCIFNTTYGIHEEKGPDVNSYIENSVISGNSINSSDYGIYIIPNVVGQTISDNIIDNSTYAIYVDEVDEIIYWNNTILNGTFGFFIDAGSENYLENNTLINNSYGIYINSSENNTILNNTFDIHQQAINISSSDNLFIDNNKIWNNTKSGIYISSSDNLTISKNNITEGTKFIHIFNCTNSLILNNSLEGMVTETGIFYDNCTTGLVSNNTLINTDFSKMNIGINLNDTQICNITNNIFQQFYEGVNVSYSSNLISIRENNVTARYISIYIKNIDNLEICNNTVLEYPNYEYGIYVIDATSINVSFNDIESPRYGIRLSETNNAKLLNNSILNSEVGIRLIDTMYSSIIGNTINTTDSEGILSNPSSHNFIEDNFIYDTGQDGILIDAGTNNTVSNNTLYETQNGISLSGTSLTKVQYNKINGSQDASIQITTSNENNILYNNLTQGSGDGIYISSSDENQIIGNWIYKHGTGTTDYGIDLYEEDDNNNIFKNNIVNNTRGIHVSLSEGNYIYLNNFINNSVNVLLEGAEINNWNSPNLQNYVYNNSYYSYYLGNYYHDYEGSYLDAGIGFDNYQDDCWVLWEPIENYWIVNIAKDPTSTSIENDVGENRSFSIELTELSEIKWYIDGSLEKQETNVNSTLNLIGQIGTWNISVIASNENGTVTYNWTWDVSPTLTNVSYNPSNDTLRDPEGYLRVLMIELNQIANITWYLNSTPQLSVVNDNSSLNLTAQEGLWNITVYAFNENGTVTIKWMWEVFEPLVNISITPLDITPRNPIGDNRTFTIELNQVANITWYLNNSNQLSELKSISFLNLTSQADIWNVTMHAFNENGSITITWLWEGYLVLECTPNQSENDTIVGSVGENILFLIELNQIANITWYLNGEKAFSENSNESTFSFTLQAGTWNISVLITNENGTKSYTWICQGMPTGGNDYFLMLIFIFIIIGIIAGTGSAVYILYRKEKLPFKNKKNKSSKIKEISGKKKFISTEISEIEPIILLLLKLFIPYKTISNKSKSKTIKKSKPKNNKNE